MVFGALVFKLSVYCGAEGYVSGLRAAAPHHTDNLKTKAPNTTDSNHLYNTLEVLMMGIVVPETCWASNKIYNKNRLLHLVGILFPNINDDAWSESLQIDLLYSIWFANKRKYHECVVILWLYKLLYLLYQKGYSGL